MTDQLREMLTNAGRVLAMEGHGDYVAGHISARLPGDSGTLLMKPPPRVATFENKTGRNAM
jgi:hypothetical protein